MAGRDHLSDVLAEEEEEEVEEEEAAAAAGGSGGGAARAVERRWRKRQAPHSLDAPSSDAGCCCSSGVVSLELDITGVVLGVG